MSTMIRHAVVALAFLCLLATAAVAQNADLSISIAAPETVDAKFGFQWTATVTNAGPDAAHNVTVTAAVTPNIGNCFTSSLDVLAANAQQTFTCITRPTSVTEDIRISMMVSHSGTDPDLSNNTATAVVRSIVGPDVDISLDVPRYVDPGLPFDVGVRVYDVATLPAHGVVVTVDVPAEMPIVKIPDNCTRAGTRVTCSLGTLPAVSFHDATMPPQVTFTVMAATVDRNGFQGAFHASVTTSDPEGHVVNNDASAVATTYQMFWVDGDPNTLAAAELTSAIEQANGSCTSDTFPCKIAFRLRGTPDADGFYRIPLLAPLPVITGRFVVIDGGTQTRYVGDTNPNGPEIFIDGSMLGPEADGFTLASACAELEGLAIGNFGGAGVVTAPPSPDSPFTCLGQRSIHDNYIGVDPSGTKAAANGRGIVYRDGRFLGPEIARNVISGNTRSAIFLANARQTLIHDNAIGLDAKGNPLGNGASGIYVAPAASEVDIRGNFIAFNHEFGVAIDKNAEATDVEVNSIYANWNMGIDRGLDGPSPDPLTPVITSAIYDAASDTTSITVSTAATNTGIGPDVNVYASDAPHSSGRGEGQYFLGQIRVQDLRTVTLPAKGDWRGKWVSATMSRNQYVGFDPVLLPDTNSTTSEFSVAVKVE